ncbi:hypothetical protein FQZ97_1071030 [compost metagenome]
MLGHVDLLEMTETQHPRAVEQEPQLAVVQGAEVRQRGFHRRQVGDIQGPLPDAAQGLRLGRQGLGVAVDQPHVPATLMEQPGGGGADAGSGTGNQDVVHLRRPLPHACR